MHRFLLPGRGSLVLQHHSRHRLPHRTREGHRGIRRQACSPRLPRRPRQQHLAHSGNTPNGGTFRLHLIVMNSYVSSPYLCALFHTDVCPVPHLVMQRLAVSFVCQQLDNSSTLLIHTLPAHIYAGPSERLSPDATRVCCLVRRHNTGITPLLTLVCLWSHFYRALRTP